jgi:hypothetical protein
MLLADWMDLKKVGWMECYDQNQNSWQVFPLGHLSPHSSDPDYSLPQNITPHLLD